MIDATRSEAIGAIAAGAVHINTEMNYLCAHRSGDVRRAQLGPPPQNRPMAGDRTHRRREMANVATSGAWLCTHLWEHYDLHRCVTDDRSIDWARAPLS